MTLHTTPRPRDPDACIIVVGTFFFFSSWVILTIWLAVLALGIVHR